MTEPAFREIQLTKKQLVFLFMASVVLAAVVFLLGVSLGRRLPTATQSADRITPAADETVPSEMPPPTTLTVDDHRYATELQGSGVVPPGTVVPPPAPAPTAPARGEAAPAQAQAAPPPQTAQTKPVEAAPSRASTAAASTPTAKPAPNIQNGWYVQVNAFRSRANAESEVGRLKARGHTAFVAPGGSLFRVRVGPFAQRPEADAAATKLRQDGYKPSITK